MLEVADNGFVAVQQIALASCFITLVLVSDLIVGVCPARWRDHCACVMLGVLCGM
jgi:hypothetical protein